MKKIILNAALLAGCMDGEVDVRKTVFTDFNKAIGEMTLAHDNANFFDDSVSPIVRFGDEFTSVAGNERTLLQCSRDEVSTACTLAVLDEDGVSVRDSTIRVGGGVSASGRAESIAEFYNGTKRSSNFGLVDLKCRVVMDNTGADAIYAMDQCESQIVGVRNEIDNLFNKLK